MEHRAAAGRALNSFPAGGNERTETVEPLMFSIRNGGTDPTEKSQNGRAVLVMHVLHCRYIIGHVVWAGHGRGGEDFPGFEPREDSGAHLGMRLEQDEWTGTAFHRRLGWRAAVTSSSRRTGVECGAVRSKSGFCSASCAIWFIASINPSKVCLDSVSVGSIIMASSTMS